MTTTAAEQDESVVLTDAWLQPLSRYYRRSTVTLRLLRPKLITRADGLFIEAVLPNSRNARRYSAADRVKVLALQGAYTGTVERTFVGDGVRTLVIRVAR